MKWKALPRPRSVPNQSWSLGYRFAGPAIGRICACKGDLEIARRKTPGSSDRDGANLGRAEVDLQPGVRINLRELRRIADFGQSYAKLVCASDLRGDELICALLGNRRPAVSTHTDARVIDMEGVADAEGDNRKEGISAWIE